MVRCGCDDWVSMCAFWVVLLVPKSLCDRFELKTGQRNLDSCTHRCAGYRQCVCALNEQAVEPSHPFITQATVIFLSSYHILSHDVDDE